MSSRKMVKIEYCPIDKMLADYFTKPLQWANFRKFCDQVLGLHAIDNINDANRSVLNITKNEMNIKN